MAFGPVSLVVQKTDLCFAIRFGAPQSRIYVRRGGGGFMGPAPEPAISAVSGPQLAVSPLQHSAWFTPNIGQPCRAQAA